MTYSTGTVSLTNGSTTVTGTGTSWIGAVRAGDLFLGPGGAAYAIASVNSATSITLLRPWAGSTASGQPYAAMPSQSRAVELAAAAQELIDDFQAAVNGPLAGIWPKGSLAAPALRFSGDLDTGFDSLGANILSLIAGGSEQLRLTGGVASGAAVQSSDMDVTAGRLLKAGSNGFGRSAAFQFSGDVLDPNLPGGQLYYATTTATNRPGGNGHFLTFRYLDAYAARFYIEQTGTGRVYTNVLINDVWTGWRQDYHTGNVTVDANGFLKAASPIVRLYTDSIEEPNEEVGASLTHPAAGHYVLTGTPPLAAEGWQTQAPDGMALETAWIDGDLHLWLTDAAGLPADVPERTFALLRFWEPAEEGEAPPVVESLSEVEATAAAAERIQRTYTAAIEAHVDEVARQKQYTGAVSAASYVASTNALWAAEAQAFVAWRDAVWASALQQLAAAQQSGEVPALADLIAGLPDINWPEAA